MKRHSIKKSQECEDKVIGTFESEPTLNLITVEKVPYTASEPYFYYFNGPDLEHSTSAARISLLGPWYVTKGKGLKPPFELDVYQIAGLIDFMNQHSQREEYKHLTNWQCCLKLFNKENAESHLHVDEDLYMPDYKTGLIESLLDSEPYEYYLGVYETAMNDLESMILKKLENYEAGSDNPHFYDSDIIDILYDPKTAKDFLEKEGEYLKSVFMFDNDEDLKDEVSGLLASKRYEICTRQEGVKDILRRELKRQISRLNNED